MRSIYYDVARGNAYYERVDGTIIKINLKGAA